MNIADLRAAVPPLAERLNDAKEALSDALLNLTWQRASGAGDEGATVFGAKPSLRFVSGFLLPRYEETGQEDETSDIHLSTHGLDFQIGAAASGSLIVRPTFAIYVRALPSWEELTDQRLQIFPNPPIEKEIETTIRGAMKDRLAEAVARNGALPESERRQRRDLQQEIYRALLAEHGVRVSSEGWVADEEAVPADGEDVNPEGNDAAALAAQRGQYIFDRDESAQAIDIPQKWHRLAIVPEALVVDLSDESGALAAATAWAARLRGTIDAAVAAWTETPEGRDWAYRPATIRPSNTRSAAAWNAFLLHLRQTPSQRSDIAPNLDGISLLVGFDRDLRDPDRRNVRVLLENNSREVATRKRNLFDHAIHQVGLEVELPWAAHRPLRLDRVESSYRFRDFLTYPAIGINCGIAESIRGDQLRLTTTWMPRYQQPRVVPTEVPGAPTRFQTLGADGFDPASLNAIVAAYTRWIDGEEQRIDPAQGVGDAEEADRERQKFRDDLAAYRGEAQRISLGIQLLSAAHANYAKAPDSESAWPYRAWLLLNRAFAEAGSERGITDWRLFQLTFILAHLPTLASRTAAYAKAPWFDPAFDEETATLLYFPTGGGKSEAFFGLLLFNLFFDRLRGKELGVTALIRYPLRLLTLQQAQRLLKLLMHAELVRRAAGVPGETFEIGFWVGSGNTPNRPDDPRLEAVPRRDSAKHPDDQNAGPAYREVNDSFNKTPSCPLCREATGLRRIVCSTAEEIAIVCFNRECRWNRATSGRPLPLLIVDRDIYRHAPAVLLGVIDKLALIGQHPATINRVVGMFGLARWRERDGGRLVMPTRKMLKEGPEANGCEVVAPAYAGGREVFSDPFPSLIIQDEAHLLEESLGTFAGLFETMLEQILTRAAAFLKERVARSPFGGHPPRLPKVIAATATVSVPEQQFGALYQRRHMHFPYPGTTLYRSFYSAPAVPSDPARRGVAGNSPRAPEIEAPWMRSYVALMTNGRNHTVTTVAVLAAYHLAITELWQDLQDDAARAAAVQRIVSALSAESPLRPFHARAVAACAAAAPEILPTLLDLMRISLTYVTNKKGGDQVIDAFREEVAKTHQRHGRVLVQLHTRLISGGIDVAEIQEIMREAEAGHRPGAPFPDLEQSLRNIVATSAISHGVDVDTFNAMFFAGMPNDVAEFIQASSRVGRTHVGFCLLIPTPQARRDRYIVETHDVFHRFLERMIAPPAITRWATSAIDRVLTSLFQAWLCGWAEQKLFVERADDAKERALTFETVADVNKLLSGVDLPGAAKDFMEFAVAALGVPGRGVAHVGAAPHQVFYEGHVRNLAKELTDVLRTQYTTTKLHDYWEGAAVGRPPMMSLRDIDEAGHFVASRPFGGPRLRGDDEKAVLAEALRIVRRQHGRVGELDADEGA